MLYFPETLGGMVVVGPGKLWLCGHFWTVLHWTETMRKLQGKLLWAKGGGGEPALSRWQHCHAKELQRAVCVHTIVGVITWFWSHYHFSGNEMGLAFVLCRLIKDLSCLTLSGCVLSRVLDELLWLHHLQKWNLYFPPLESNLELLSNNCQGKALTEPLLDDLSLKCLVFEWSHGLIVPRKFLIFSIITMFCFPVLPKDSCGALWRAWSNWHVPMVEENSGGLRIAA